MLSTDQLSQLTQLKKDIRTSKNIQTGIVRGTSGRYGFVALEDGKDAFLNPEQMDRVFPGDKVEVAVTTTEQNGKEQYEAKLEKLIESPLSSISGRYRVRGKGHFLAIDSPNFSRWIFIPPKNRAKCQDGDYATAKLTQHPFKDGRSQAKITHKIGNKDTHGLERLYAIEKFALPQYFSKPAHEQAQSLISDITAEHDASQRQDLRHLPFVTIDSAATRDMDDALCIEQSANGWLLSVAIADPGSEIGLDSALDKDARSRTQTVYFPGKPLAMLPENLSIERYSLKSEEDRLSLVFQCEIDHEGQVSSFTFIPAIVKSHAKLSYAQVAALLEDKAYQVPEQLSDATPFKQQLTDLLECSQTLLRYRQQHYIVNNSKPDYALYLNDKGKLEKIEKIERNCAHTIVEEAMLLTNRCAGDFLAQHQVGLYVHHRGYRQERREDIEALLSEKTNGAIESTDQLQRFIDAVTLLQNNDDYQPLLSIQQRFLEASQLNDIPSPHFGLGFKHYATVTSPIRRYQDLYNQRLIHQILANQTPDTLNEQQLNDLRQQLNDNREAVRFVEQWLIADYIKHQIGNTFSASISLLTNKGIGVRLDNTGIEGFIPAKRADKKNPDAVADKISFNNQRMELSWNGKELLLDQTVQVKLSRIDEDKNKLEFDWAE